MQIRSGILLFQTAVRRGDRGIIGRRPDMANVRANQVAQQMSARGEHERRAPLRRSAKAVTAEYITYSPLSKFVDRPALMKLAWQNIIHYRARFSVSVLGVSFAVFLMVFQGSLLVGFLRAASRLI